MAELTWAEEERGMFVMAWLLQYVTLEAVVSEVSITKCFPGFSSSLRIGYISEPTVPGVAKIGIVLIYFLAPRH